MSDETQPADETAELPHDEWGVLADRLDEDYPPAWIPGKERKDTGEVDADTIMGTMVRYDDAQTRRNESAKVLVLAERATGELRSVWLLHMASRAKIDVLSPVPGDRLAIRQLGLKESESNPGQTYMDYKVAIIRASQPGVPPAPASLPTPNDDLEGQLDSPDEPPSE